MFGAALSGVAALAALIAADPAWAAEGSLPAAPRGPQLSQELVLQEPGNVQRANPGPNDSREATAGPRRITPLVGHGSKGFVPVSSVRHPHR